MMTAVTTDCCDCWPLQLPAPQEGDMPTINCKKQQSTYMRKGNQQKIVSMMGKGRNNK